MEARIGEYPVPYYVGIDLHKRYSYVVVLNEVGEVVEERKVSNEELKEFAEKYRGSKAVIESTGSYRFAYDILDRYMDVKLAHPSKTRIIAEARIKNDSLDAKMLAHLLRTNLIAESYIPPKEVRELRDLTRARRALIEDRNRIKNRVHAILIRNGINDYPNPFTKKGREFLKELQLPELDKALLESNLSIIDKINEEIKKIDKIIQEKAKEDNEAILLMTIPGVSYYSALLIKAEIGDINRFPNHEKLVSYAGLCPSIRQSGEKEIRGRITKQGSKLLRWILVQCANAAVRNDEYLRNFYLRIRRESHNVAIVATARKPESTRMHIYHMLKKKEAYNPR